MKKRLVILSITVVTGLSAIGSASAALWARPGAQPASPGGAQCGMADLTCKA